MKTLGKGIHISRVYVENADRLIPHLGGNVQAVRSDCWRAVAFAALLAVRSFERKTNRAKTPGGEFLLRLAGTLQISDAIRKIGVVEGENYLVVFGSREEASEIIEKLGLRELPLTSCGDEKVKTFFEKAALVEVL
ncbi:KEOPS complex subunit Cgi121 [Thermococcus sp. M36]|uniref:KEOPS complex subunit Cgi121 n=1 Tax=Thermococcus sp. M36 TaxID=1638261 RepID=UPI00143A9366|nr:KEOPS complex subunit Cgi121 [Thermococcus sp. M36]NJE05044.1 KEOPS complex subunit Cgi121 [Thermococcus sp. M36]